jgi:NADH dehydrogenase FAD-containing subunit
MSVRQTAQKELEKLRVRFIGSAKVTSTTQEGQAVVQIHHDSGKQETLKADVFIPTYGVVPNTAYLPPSMLDSRGFVETTYKLGVEGYDNIFAVGDVSNIQDTKATSTDAQVVYLSKALHARLTGGNVTEYVPNKTMMTALSLGKNRGTGQMGTWKPFSLIIWYFKSRYLGTDTAAEVVAGNRTLTQKNW